MRRLALLFLLVLTFAPSAHAATGWEGVNSPRASRTYEDSLAEMKEEIKEAVALKITHLRVPVDWRAIETAHETRPEIAKEEEGVPGNALKRLDNLAKETAKNGIELDGTIATTPSWASVGGAWNDAPSSMEYAREFAKWLSQRYWLGQMTIFGALNEPNNGGNYFKTNGESFSNITELTNKYMEEANAIVKGAHEGNAFSKVLIGESGNAEGFLKKVIEKGINEDGIGLHAYAEGGAPTEAEAEANETSTANTTEHKVKEVHELTTKPIWVQEWGYSNEHGEGETQAEWETKHAEYTKAGVEYLDGVAYVQGWAYYELHSPVEGEEKCENHKEEEQECFGLVRHDFSKRPSFKAFQEGL